MPKMRTALSRITGNSVSQRLIGRNVEGFLFLMGIGSGDFVECSGEGAALGLLRQSYNSPYCIFDVGSNQGQYLNLILRELPQNELTVHCFEPGAHTYELLKKNLEPAGKKVAVLNNIALGVRHEERTLYYNRPGSGLASLTKRRMDHHGVDLNSSETVRVDTIDNYCRTNAINHIHLLKCDVEGHELDVFKGASDMFGNRAIDIATFEFGGCNIDTRTFFQDFFYFFKDAGMNILRITPSRRLQPVDSYKEMYEQFRCTNYVAVRNDGQGNEIMS